MKKLIAIVMMSLPMLVMLTGCNGTSKESNPTNDSIQVEQLVDSVALALSRLDSIQEQGKLVHFDTWKIGSLKGVEVQAQKFSSDNDSIVFITLRKDCGGEYYYSWEDAFIYPKELPSLYEAVNTIKSSLNRTTDHNEKYAYFTKDNVAILAENSGKGWSLKLSVDTHKSNSYINVTLAELEKFVELLRLANKKLDEVQ